MPEAVLSSRFDDCDTVRHPVVARWRAARCAIAPNRSRRVDSGIPRRTGSPDALICVKAHLERVPQCSGICESTLRGARGAHGCNDRPAAPKREF
jgi:hypothetical protein